MRSVSDLERGSTGAHSKDTARLLADALGLIGPVRARFEALARGRAVPGGAGTGGVAAATRTLPRDIASFTGRQQELRGAGGCCGRCGRGGRHSRDRGMAGVGKTAFAVHAAHQLAPRFPDGQIFLPLHGHTPGQQPVDPDDALASLLLTAGVAAGQIPPGWKRGWPCGGTGWRASSCCWCSMTRPAASRSGRCCPAPAAAWCWSPAAAT